MFETWKEDPGDNDGGRCFFVSSLSLTPYWFFLVFHRRGAFGFLCALYMGGEGWVFQKFVVLDLFLESGYNALMT